MVTRTLECRKTEVNAFEASGFVLLPDLISHDELPRLRAEVDRLLSESDSRGGVRNVLAKSPDLHALAISGPPSRAARALLGPGARPTKLTIFDKTPRANWKVPWHQDLTLSVQERKDVPGFGPWTIKGGVPHVQPPVALLEQVIALRLHLDDTPAENGALRVLPGTHKLGRLSNHRIASLRRETPEVVCAVPAGGGMIMSPLLLHASSVAEVPARRRVLHFELVLCGCRVGWSGGKESLYNETVRRGLDKRHPSGWFLGSRRDPGGGQVHPSPHKAPTGRRRVL